MTESALTTSIDDIGFDTLAEIPISASNAAKYFYQLTGESVSIRTIYRWMMKGRSGVRLQHLKMARKKFTSRESMNRFFNRTTESPEQRRQQPVQRKKPVAKSIRQRQIEAARQNLIARGILADEAV